MIKNVLNIEGLNREAEEEEIEFRAMPDFEEIDARGDIGLRIRLIGNDWSFQVSVSMDEVEEIYDYVKSIHEASNGSLKRASNDEANG